MPKKTGWKDIEVLIVGAGTMGASLAQTYAQAGFHVGMLDISERIINEGFETINRELEAARGRIFSPAETAAIRARIIGTTSYEQACSGRNLNLVIEAATERLDIKERIFRQLDSLVPRQAVLASNSSSLDINIVAGATKRPDRVVWMHYFYLPHKNRAGEYAGTDAASAESKELARRYLKLGGKIPTHIRGSRKGGVADIIFVALLLEATRMLEDGHDMAAVEEAGKVAYGIPIGFLELMDATGLPVGLYSMRSFSDASRPDDPLYRVYGNFYEPRQNYIDLVKRHEQATDKSAVRWIPEGARLEPPADGKRVEELADRFRAVGFLTAAECVDAKLVTIEDLETLTQNAFLWRKGPFTLMNELGPRRVEKAVRKRAELARTHGQDFPVCALLKKKMTAGKPWSFRLAPVLGEKEADGAIRRITLSNPRSANSMDNATFAALEREFHAADKDPACKVVIFDTAPIKTFIAGANIPAFVERIKAGDFEAIQRDTAEWQRILFRVMTGSAKPRVAIVDGQAFGGGVEVALAFALDPNSVVLITNRTSYALPETRLGIYPGLRGTLSLPQLIYRKTGDPETAVALARYFMLAGGTATSSPQAIHHLGCADFIVPQHRRDEAAAAIAAAVITNGGRLPPPARLRNLKFERLEPSPSAQDLRELQLAVELFSQADLLPTLYAQARGHLPLYYTGEMKAAAERIVRRVAANSPNAVWVTQYLISRGFEGFLNGADNERLAAFELEHHLRQTFEHPDAFLGLVAMLKGRFPNFARRYPTSTTPGISTGSRPMMGPRPSSRPGSTRGDL